MIKTKLAIIIDSCLISLSLTLIVYIWCARYIKNAFFIYFVCILALLCLFNVVFKHFLKRYKIEHINLKDSKIADKSFNFLKYCSAQNYNFFFEKLLNSKHINGKIFENQSTIFYINLKTITTDLDFQIANEFYQNSAPCKNLIFILDTKTNEFESLISNSPITLQTYNKPELFELMKHRNTFPVEANFQTKLKTFKLPHITLSKSRFKELFFSGISLLAISLIIPYTFYYLFVGSFLLILSIICLFKKAPPIEKSKQKLEDLIKEKDNVIKT